VRGHATPRRRVGLYRTPNLLAGCGHGDPARPCALAQWRHIDQNRKGAPPVIDVERPLLQWLIGCPVSGVEDLRTGSTAMAVVESAEWLPAPVGAGIVDRDSCLLVRHPGPVEELADTATVPRSHSYGGSFAGAFVLAILIAATVGFLVMKDHNTTASYVIVVVGIFVLSIAAGIALKVSRWSSS